MPFERNDRDLLQNVTASVLVPALSTASIDEILEAHPEVEQRTNLYFGRPFEAR